MLFRGIISNSASQMGRHVCFSSTVYSIHLGMGFQGPSDHFGMQSAHTIPIMHRQEPETISLTHLIAAEAVTWDSEAALRAEAARKDVQIIPKDCYAAPRGDEVAPEGADKSSRYA